MRLVGGFVGWAFGGGWGEGDMLDEGLDFVVAVAAGVVVAVDVTAAAAGIVVVLVAAAVMLVVGTVVA